jgi:UDP-4-amino-4-deoxy-L-arabinose-oxoglutarate aminotransferase
MKMIPHSRPWVIEGDLEAVAAVLRSEMIGQGETAARFEAAMSQWLGLNHAGVAVASGAASLQLALRALGVGTGDEVILPTYVCRSVLDAIRTVGATAVLSDVGRQWVVTPSNVAPLIGAHTRAIVVPHMYGIFADVAAFREFGIPIVEDCAQALGRSNDWTLEGDVGVFSFHPTKCLTTGEGGLAVARDPALNERLRAVGEGGPRRRALAPLSDLAAALGLSQLARYDAALSRRRRIADIYRSALGDRASALLCRTPWDRAMHFRFPLSWAGGVDSCATAFARNGIVVRRGADQLLHRIMGKDDRGFPTATELFETTVSIPIYPALSDVEVAICASALAALCGELALK